MINQISIRLWDASSAMLSPAGLIDRLLDTIEMWGIALMPVQASARSCPEVPFEADLDPFGA